MTCSGPPLSAQSDEDLVELYVTEGNADAMGVLYLRYRPVLLAYAYGKLEDHEDAKDLVQATWEAILTWKGLGGAGKFILPTAKRIASNIALNWKFHRAVIKRNHAALIAVGGKPLPSNTVCKYCERAAVHYGMCPGHEQRKARGWSEEDMRKPFGGGSRVRRKK